MRKSGEVVLVPLFSGLSRHRAWLFVLAWLFWELPDPGNAQSPDEARPSIRMGASTGTRRYRPGSWGVVAVETSNPTDEDAELAAVVYIAGDPALQYGRRIWVPPKSVLKSTCPLQIPDTLPPGTDHVDLVSVPVDPVGGTKMTVRSHLQATIESRPLVVVDEPVAVGILGDFKRSNMPGEGLPFYTGQEIAATAPDDLIHDLVRAGCHAQGLLPRVAAINARELPADMASLDALDVLVLCTDRVASDPDAVALIRNWVLGGGHLWIMLDELAKTSVSAILGDSFTSTIVDRVELADLTIQDVRVETQPEESTVLAFDEPIAFVRVLPGNATVTDTVNGWPAAFWQPFGAGRISYTTLQARAWFDSAVPIDPQSQPTATGSSFAADGPLKRFVSDCFPARPRNSRNAVNVEPILAKQIGYRILSRELVAAVLAAFCLLLAVAGTWYWKIGCLDRLLWAWPLAATGASLLFLAVAATARNAVPPTAAVWQRIDLEPGVATAQACGLASLYNPEIDDTELGATQGGLVLPDMAAMRSQRRRMMWTDEGSWHWEDLKLPPGVRTAPLEQVLHLENPVACRARFGPSGLTGVFGPDQFTGLADAVITLPRQPLLAAKMGPGGSFAASPGDVLAPGQFMTGTLLSDAQQRHADAYQLLFTHDAMSNAPPRPVFHVWADPVELGFVFPQSNRLGSALISIPLEIERSSAGSQVTVPAPFVVCGAVNGPDGKRSSAYSSFRGEWSEMQYAVSQWLRFQMPEAVLPLELSRAEISLSIRAPSRSVDILGLRDGRPVVVKNFNHPIGSYQVVLDQPQLLQLDDEGGLTLAVRVSNDQSSDLGNLMTQAPWRIEYLRMAVVGKVQGE